MNLMGQAKKERERENSRGQETNLGQNAVQMREWGVDDMKQGRPIEQENRDRKNTKPKQIQQWL